MDVDDGKYIVRGDLDTIAGFHIGADVSKELEGKKAISSTYSHGYTRATYKAELLVDCLPYLVNGLFKAMLDPCAAREGEQVVCSERWHVSAGSLTARSVAMSVETLLNDPNVLGDEGYEEGPNERLSLAHMLTTGQLSGHLIDGW